MSESGPLQETKKKEVPQGHQDRPYSKRVIQKDQNSAPQGQQYRLYRKESDPKGRKIVPQGHQDRLYRSSAQHKPKQHLGVNNTDFTKKRVAQQQKQASRSPRTTSLNESTQKREIDRNQRWKARRTKDKRPNSNKSKNPTTYSHPPWPYVIKPTKYPTHHHQ